MKRKMLVLGTMLMLCLTACGNTDEEVLSNITEGRVSISGCLNDCRTIKVNLPTSCCDEYNIATAHVNSFEHASGYQIYTIDMYNKKNKETDPNGIIYIDITLSDEMLNASGTEYKVYRLAGINLVEIVATENNGILSFESEKDGTYVIVKFDNSATGEPEYLVPSSEGACGCC